MKKLAWLAVALGLGACSSLDKLNPFSSEPPKRKMAELTSFTPSAALASRWQVHVGVAGESEFHPAVTRSVVLAAAADGSLVRVEDGKEVWRIKAEQPITGGVGSDGRYAAVGTRKGEVLLYDALGKLQWKAQVSSEVLSAPVFVGGNVVVRSGDNRINAFALGTGKQVWTYQRATPALSLRSAVGVTAGEKTIYAGFPGGKLVALNASNGSPIWEGTVAIPKGTTELERIADVSSNPVVDGRVVCAAAYQGRVACFDAGSGEALWARDVSSSRGIALDRTRVFVSDDSGALQALDRDSGASLWKQNKLLGRGLTQPLVMGKFVAVADSQGVVHLLKTEDGSLASRIDTDASAIVAPPLAQEGGSFVVQTVKGSVFSLAF